MQRKWVIIIVLGGALVFDWNEKNKLKFTVSIYEVKDQHISILTNVKTEDGTSFSYSPEGNNNTYIFAIQEINQILAMNEGLEELLNILLNEFHNYQKQLHTYS